MSVKKWATYLVILLCLALLVGCTTPATTAAPTTAGTTKAATTAASTAPTTTSKYKMSDVPNMTDKGVLPIVENKVAMTFGIRTMSNVTDYENNYLTKYLEEKTGIDIVFEFLPNAIAEATSKIDLAIAAGNTLPDVIYVLGIGSSKIQKYGQAGNFADLTNYYGKYAYYYNMAYEKVSADYMNYLKQVITSEDGKIYSIPNIDFSITNAYRNEFHLNSVWMKKLGLQFPKTTDELYTLLKAFKEKDPNGNGKADEIPLVWSQKESFSGGSANFLNAFEYMAASGLSLAADGSLQMCKTTEGYREGLRFIRKLVSESLISPLTYTITTAELKTMLDLAEGQAAYVGGFVEAMVLGFAANSKRKFDYESYTALLNGPGGKAYSTFFPYGAVASTYINGKSKIKEIAFRFIDYMFEKDTAIITRFGEENKHWKKVPDTTPPRFVTGFKSYYDIITNFWGSSQNANWNLVIANGPLVQWTRGDTPWADPKNPTIQEYQGAKTATCVAANSAKGAQPDKIVMTPILTIAETAEIAEILTTLNTYIAESEAKFSLGEMNLDTDWAKYQNELKTIGLEKYLKVATAAYKRMTK